MAKKIIIVVALTIVIVGGVFAQDGTMPKNTVTVDIGPTMVGVAIGSLGNTMGEEGFSTSGFGIGAQYERQLFERLSVAGRFAYLGGGLGIGEEDRSEGLKAVLEMKLAAFCLEGHVRYFPFGESFFLGGILGYANMSSTFSGEVIGTDEYDNKVKESISFKASRNFFKLGAKLGWRIDFGSQGGFVFEPSFGYDMGIGIGDTLAKKLSDEVGADMSGFDTFFTLVQDFVFVGGPRVSLAFGWRF